MLCMTLVLKTGARKRSRFISPVSGACVMRISDDDDDDDDDDDEDDNERYCLECST